jgi:hypothetical protein
VLSSPQADAAHAAELEVARARLAVLSGAGLGRGLALRAPAGPRSRFNLPDVLVEQIVDGRPALQAAFWRAASAERRLEIAMAGASPSYSPSAFAGFRSHGLNHLIRSGADIGQASLGFRTSTAEVRPGRAEIVEAAMADTDAASAALARALLVALRDAAADILPRAAGAEVGSRRLISLTGRLRADRQNVARLQAFVAGALPNPASGGPPRATSQAREATGAGRPPTRRDHPQEADTPGGTSAEFCAQQWGILGGPGI